jgi:hypothetical protein
MPWSDLEFWTALVVCTTACVNLAKTIADKRNPPDPP